jgi:SAM-dependent methyltransferase
MYLARRLALRRPGRFLDVGTGTGEVANELLSRGWSGLGIDRNPEALEKNREVNRKFLSDGRYQLVAGDFMEFEPADPYDLVISMMVLEHLPEEMVLELLHRKTAALAHGGTVAFFVPASPRHWGIEDEIAGHLRRYTAASVRQVCAGAGLIVKDLAGLTYPLSNLLVPLSNAFVRQSELGQLGKDLERRTLDSGRRNVRFKTRFPSVFRLILNPVVLYPFHLLQLAFRNHPSSLVIYVECEPPMPRRAEGESRVEVE